MVLWGGDAGLRLGEIVALEWVDVDLHARRITVEQSDWCDHVTVPKGGRSRRLPMTQRLTSALKPFRHLRSERGVVSAGWNAHHARSGDQGDPWSTARRRVAPGRRARATAYLLFASGDEGRAGSRDSGAGRTRGSVHDATLHALESGGDGRRDPVARRATIRCRSCESLVVREARLGPRSVALMVDIGRPSERNGASSEERAEWSEPVGVQGSPTIQERTEWSELAKRERNEVSQAGCRGPRRSGNKAGYGDRTRLTGLGSQDITTMLSPRSADFIRI